MRCKQLMLLSCNVLMTHRSHYPSPDNFVYVLFIFLEHRMFECSTNNVDRMGLFHFLCNEKEKS